MKKDITLFLMYIVIVLTLAWLLISVYSDGYKAGTRTVKLEKVTYEQALDIVLKQSTPL